MGLTINIWVLKIAHCCVRILGFGTYYKMFDTLIKAVLRLENTKVDKCSVFKHTAFHTSMSSGWGWGVGWRLDVWGALGLLLLLLLCVCTSVRPSVCHTFVTMFLSSYHPEVFRRYQH